MSVNMRVVHIPKARKDRGKFPQTLFFYRHGEGAPAYKFTRSARTCNWIGHGIHKMSVAQVAKWVDDQERTR